MKSETIFPLNKIIPVHQVLPLAAERVEDLQMHL